MEANALSLLFLVSLLIVGQILYLSHQTAGEQSVQCLQDPVELRCQPPWAQSPGVALA